MALAPAHASATNSQATHPTDIRDRWPRWYFWIAILLLIVAAFFRLHHLSVTPPGLQADEILNIQLADRMRQGFVSVVYSDVTPARSP
ncbi:MAG: hypothetical protein P8Z40_16690 [Chloroflexota bacterium]